MKRFVSDGTAQLRARVERGTLRTGDAYRVKRQLVLSTTPRAAEEEAEQLTAALRIAFDEPGRRPERHTFHLLKLDSRRRKARLEGLARLKTMVAATSEEPARFREQMNQLLTPVQRIARREIAYMRARGDLSSDYPTLVDGIEKTLASASLRVHEHPRISIEEDTLHRVVLSVLRDESVHRPT